MTALAEVLDVEERPVPVLRRASVVRPCDTADRRSIWPAACMFSPAAPSTTASRR